MKTISTFFLQLDNVSAGLTEWKGFLRDCWTQISSYCKRANNVNVNQVTHLLFKRWIQQMVYYIIKSLLSSRKKNRGRIRKWKQNTSAVWYFRWKRCWRRNMGTSYFLFFLIIPEHVQGMCYGYLSSILSSGFGFFEKNTMM